MKNKVIMIEFNELCPPLLQKYMSEGLLPNFKKLFEMGFALRTVADAESPDLEPWIQWVSVHTGVPYSEHKVKRLTDGPLSKHKDIWTYLAENNLKVGNFSSMNAKSFQFDGSFFFPDPWTQTEKPYPIELSPLNNFISQNVQNHTHNSAEKVSSLDFLKFYATHGLRLKTITKVMMQLVKERLQDRQSWRRAFVLDWICQDVFNYFISKNRPDFATFFSNSTAHMQHAYWRQHEPEAFELKPSLEDVNAFGSAIRDAYVNHDKMLAGFFELRKRFGYELAVVSALSQQPYTKLDKVGGQHFYRFLDVSALVKSLGFSPLELLPTMAHQYRVRFKQPGEAAAFRSMLNSIKRPGSDDRSLFECILDDEFSLYFACGVTSYLDLNKSVQVDGSEIKLSTIFYKLDDMKSGMHHPEGIAWFTWPVQYLTDDKAQLMDIFPTICEKLNVPIMREVKGNSLSLPKAYA